MAERMNGNASQYRRTHGSERRGVASTPKHFHELRRQQSLQDKAKVRQLIETYKAREVEVVKDTGLGNRDLPAYQHKAELVANIETHKAVILGGETGSGKSTQLPQYLYEAGYDMTIMLVPRRVIADGLGERIRDELASQIDDPDLNFDEVVGIVHGERVERHENNKIMVMTPNTFVQMERDLHETYADKKLAIVADEIHEANLFTELATGVAAMAVQDHNDWRLIAASATHNASTLKGPFERINKGFVPTIEIKGRPFNVELREEPELTPMEAYARDGAEHAKAMIFTSGKREIQYIIDETRRELEKVERGASKDVIFRLLHGELTENELAHIDDPVAEGQRFVIVSSPAGMSGITIPGVTYVATDGTINRSELDDDGAPGLIRRYLAKASIIQQIGRAGRDVPGGIGVLCTPVIANKKSPALQKVNDTGEMEFIPFAKRQEHEPPEIYSTNLSRVVLSVSALDRSFADINEYIPHPVQPANIINAEEAIYRLGALDDDKKITETGRGMNKFPVRPELARGLYEASQPGRALQHMARAALVAAAIDAGGLQDYQASDEAVKLRKQIIRRTSQDDLMVQLDLMTKLYERTDEEWAGYDFVERHGLHPKRVERVRKSARKILAVMNIRPQNTIVVAPLPDEERQLRDDLTSGFIDFVYEDVGMARGKATLYRNIHGSKDSTIRTISDRSDSRIERQQLIAAVPRWYIKGKNKDGTPIKHDIIDHVFPVDAAVIGLHAVKNGLVQGVWNDSRMVGDKVVDFEQGTFGSISVGSPKKRVAAEAISQHSQEVLVQNALTRQGRVQKALRTLVEELEDYRQRIPSDVLAQHRLSLDVDDLTQDSVTSMIIQAATETTSLHGIEERLAAYLYSNNLTIDRYYEPESIELFKEMSPIQLEVTGEYVQINYDNGQPYVTRIGRRHRSKIQSALYLDDGREILFQREVSGGGKERVSFANAFPRNVLR